MPLHKDAAYALAARIHDLDLPALVAGLGRPLRPRSWRTTLWLAALPERDVGMLGLSESREPEWSRDETRRIAPLVAEQLGRAVYVWSCASADPIVEEHASTGWRQVPIEQLSEPGYEALPGLSDRDERALYFSAPTLAVPLEGAEVSPDLLADFLASPRPIRVPQTRKKPPRINGRGARVDAMRQLVVPVAEGVFRKLPDVHELVFAIAPLGELACEAHLPPALQGHLSPAHLVPVFVPVVDGAPTDSVERAEPAPSGAVAFGWKVYARRVKPHDRRWLRPSVFLRSFEPWHAAQSDGTEPTPYALVTRGDNGPASWTHLRDDPA